MGPKKSIAAKYAFHFLLWLIVIFSMAADTTYLIKYSKGLYIFFVFSKTLIQAFLVYLNILALYPVFFKKKKYFLYGLFVILITLMAGYANMQLEIFVDPHQPFTPGTDHFLFFLSQLGMAARYMVISFLLKITVDYYDQKETIKKIELEKTTAELNFLQAQVNPHFLFNTLNNLYALILERSDKSAECVLKLADIMKYMLAEGKEDKVILQKEVDMLFNYTGLERLRKPCAEISFHASGNTRECFITPLLLLPLIENAFKYGLNSVAKNGFVKINLEAEKNLLTLTVENNVPPLKNKDALQSLGIGIENVKKRLEMLYHGRYVLAIDKKPESYFVKLQLQLA
ncbi:MAG: sensor histidine kinase [Ferruginibacter sp.]